MKTKPANQITTTDKIVRFGHVLKIKSIARRIHPLTKSETVSITHERDGKSATVDFQPGAQVETA